jgi:hypothetical protein
MVWLLPPVQVYVHGDVQVLPSTVSVKPAGALVIVTALPLCCGVSSVPTV